MLWHIGFIWLTDGSVWQAYHVTSSFFYQTRMNWSGWPKNSIYMIFFAYFFWNFIHENWQVSCPKIAILKIADTAAHRAKISLISTPWGRKILYMRNFCQGIIFMPWYSNFGNPFISRKPLTVQQTWAQLWLPGVKSALYTLNTCDPRRKFGPCHSMVTHIRDPTCTRSAKIGNAPNDPHNELKHLTIKDTLYSFIPFVLWLAVSLIQNIQGRRKWEMHWMPPNWTWTLNSRKYSIYTKDFLLTLAKTGWLQARKSVRG